MVFSEHALDLSSSAPFEAAGVPMFRVMMYTPKHAA